MASWFVYRDDGKHIGPLSTEAVAEAILSGQFPPDVWLGAPGGSRWLRALDVPAIAQLIEGLPTRRPRESGIMPARTQGWTSAPHPGAIETVPTALPMFASTVKLKDGQPEELPPLLDAPPTERTGYGDSDRGPDGFPVPPPSSSPLPPTLDRGDADVPRKKTQRA